MTLMMVGAQSKKKTHSTTLEIVKINTRNNIVILSSWDFRLVPFFRILDFMYGVCDKKGCNMTTQAIYALFIIFSLAVASLTHYDYDWGLSRKTSNWQHSVALLPLLFLISLRSPFSGKGSLSATRNSSAAALCSVIRMKRERNRSASWEVRKLEIWSFPIPRYKNRQKKRRARHLAWKSTKSISTHNPFFTIFRTNTPCFPFVSVSSFEFSLDSRLLSEWVKNLQFSTANIVVSSRSRKMLFCRSISLFLQPNAFRCFVTPSTLRVVALHKTQKSEVVQNNKISLPFREFYDFLRFLSSFFALLLQLHSIFHDWMWCKWMNSDQMEIQHCFSFWK